MSWEIHERYKHARRNKETNIFAKDRALYNVIDQSISRAIISCKNLTHVIPDKIYLLDPTRTNYSQTCNISMWCMQKVQWWTIQDAKLADWPKEKISKTVPFTQTGLDYVSLHV